MNVCILYLQTWAEINYKNILVHFFWWMQTLLWLSIFLNSWSFFKCYIWIINVFVILFAHYLSHYLFLSGGKVLLNIFTLEEFTQKFAWMKEEKTNKSTVKYKHLYSNFLGVKRETQIFTFSTKCDYLQLQ